MKNLGDKMILSEYFQSYQSFHDKGWTLAGGTIADGKMTTDAVNQGATMPYSEGLDLIRNGFTVRMKIRTDETASTARRFFVLAIDANNSLLFAYQGGLGTFLTQVQVAGTGSNYYTASKVLPTSTDTIEIVVSWNGSEAATPRIESYQDGVFGGFDETIGSITLGLDSDYGKIKLAELTGTNDFIGDIELFELYQGSSTAEGILDAYEEDTYQEIDLSLSKFYLPGLTYFDNGTAVVTENIGTENDPIWGDGAGNFEPTIDSLGVLYNGTTSNIQFDNEVAGAGALTLGCIMRWEGTSENGGNWIFTNADSTPVGLTMFYNESSDVILFYSDDLASSSSSGAINAQGRWVTVIVARNASGVVNFYIDGKHAGTADQASGTPVVGDDNFIIGNRALLDRTFNGYINQPFCLDFEVTPRQARNLHWTLLSNLNK